MRWKKCQGVLFCAVGLFAFGATIAGTVYEDRDKPSEPIERSPAVESVDMVVWSRMRWSTRCRRLKPYAA